MSYLTSDSPIFTQYLLKYWFRIFHLVWPRYLYYLILLLPTVFLARANYLSQASTIGKGDSGIAVFSDANSLKNPANLAEYGQYYLGFEHSPSRLFQILETNQLASVFPLSDRLALGLNWNQTSLDDDELMVSKNLFHFSYSYSLTNWFSAGLNLKYLNNTASLDGRLRGSEIGWGTDVGVLFHVRQSVFRANLLSPIWLRLLNRPQRNWTQSKINPSLAFGFVVTDMLDVGLQPNSIWGTWIRHDTGVVEKYRSPKLHFGLGYQRSSQLQFSADISDRLNVGIEYKPNQYLGLRTGLYRQLSAQSQLRPTFTMGVNFQYKTFSFDWAYLIPNDLPPTTYAQFSLRLDRRTLPVEIEQVRLNHLYPVHYNFYAQTNRFASEQILDNPNQPTILSLADLDRYYPMMPEDTIGRIWLRNESSKPQEVRVELFVPEFISESGSEVASQIVVPPLKRMSIPLRQIVLTRQAIQMSQAQTVEAKIKVTEIGGTASRLLSAQLVLHGNQSTRLDDIGKLSSFISYDDPGIRSFIDQVQTAFGSRIKSNSLPVDLSMALVLFDALYGFSYTKDPNIPFESGTVDKIIYPFEMLERLSNSNTYTSRNEESDVIFGDCDDSTVLYCTLLESVGIKTALIQLPNHVLMAFQLDNISIEIAQAMSLPDIYLPINGFVWIPIETTLINSGFVAAWQGALNQLKQVEVTNSVTVGQAWEKYGANTLHHSEAIFSFDFDMIKSRMESDLNHYLVNYFDQNMNSNFNSEEK